MPQGTVLGPVLSLAYIMDIDVREESGISCFADDTRVTRAVLTMGDAHALQRDLNKIYDWAERNNMSFNSGKF